MDLDWPHLRCRTFSIIRLFSFSSRFVDVGAVVECSVFRSLSAFGWINFHEFIQLPQRHFSFRQRIKKWEQRKKKKRTQKPLKTCDQKNWNQTTNKNGQINSHKKERLNWSVPLPPFPSQPSLSSSTLSLCFFSFNREIRIHTFSIDFSIFVEADYMPDGRGRDGKQRKTNKSNGIGQP